MHKIDTYIEGLYEDINEKIGSTKAILQLAKIPENMPDLVSNGMLDLIKNH
jgi:hypothetical protein